MEEIFAELIRLMEFLDSNKDALEQNDTTIPENILIEFGSNNYFADISILDRVIDDTLAVPDFLKGKKYKKPEGIALHNARLQALRENYLSLYLPLIRSFDHNCTLPDITNV